MRKKKTLSIFFMWFVLSCSIPLLSEANETIKILLTSNSCNKPGRKIFAGDLPTPQDLATDAFCAQQIIQRSAPHGILTVFGSARLGAGSPDYELARKFAFLWTKEIRDRIPIATGGGPGIMEAANRGASEAGGKSIGLLTSFDPNAVEKPNPYLTDSYFFASFSQREAELVDRSAAVVVAMGGVGTEWEIFETITKIQTRKIQPVPVILLGKKKKWSSLLKRIDFMNKMHLISPEDRELIQVRETPEDAVRTIIERLPQSLLDSR